MRDFYACDENRNPLLPKALQVVIFAQFEEIAVPTAEAVKVEKKPGNAKREAARQLALENLNFRFLYATTDDLESPTVAAERVEELTKIRARWTESLGIGGADGALCEYDRLTIGASKAAIAKSLLDALIVVEGEMTEENSKAYIAKALAAAEKIIGSLPEPVLPNDLHNLAVSTQCALDLNDKGEFSEDGQLLLDEVGFAKLVSPEAAVEAINAATEVPAGDVPELVTPVAGATEVPEGVSEVPVTPTDLALPTAETTDDYMLGLFAIVKGTISMGRHVMESNASVLMSNAELMEAMGKNSRKMAEQTTSLAERYGQVETEIDHALASFRSQRSLPASQTAAIEAPVEEAVSEPVAA